MNDFKPKFRADLNGLRGVAVLLVIVFHLNENWLPFGYIGVDLFFVLSGYLITRNIIKVTKMTLATSSHYLTQSHFC